MVTATPRAQSALSFLKKCNFDLVGLFPNIGLEDSVIRVKFLAQSTYHQCLTKRCSAEFVLSARSNKALL